MSATLAVDRQVISRTVETVLVPKFPRIPEATKARFPELRAAWEKWERDVDAWTEGVQIVINRFLSGRERPTIVMNQTTCVTLAKATQEALRGSGGVPSNLNRFVTESDLADELQEIVKLFPTPTPPPAGSTTYEGGGNFHGIGDPNGVITANRGAIYHEFSAGFASFLRMWIKTENSSNVGWV